MFAMYDACMMALRGFQGRSYVLQCNRLPCKGALNDKEIGRQRQHVMGTLTNFGHDQNIRPRVIEETS